MRPRLTPRQRTWDHERRCHADQAVALELLVQARANLGTEYQGKRVRWRLRVCPVCGGWYIDREFARLHRQRRQRAVVEQAA